MNHHVYVWRPRARGRKVWELKPYCAECGRFIEFGHEPYCEVQNNEMIMVRYAYYAG